MYSSTRAKYWCFALTVWNLSLLPTTVNAEVYLRKIAADPHQRSLLHGDGAKSFPKITARRLHGDTVHGGFYELCSLRGEGGCVQPSSSASRTSIIVDTCKDRGDACAWYTEEIQEDQYGYEDTTVVFQSATNRSMCMQAGLGSALEDGRKIRYMPCNPTETLQHFVWVDGFESPIQPAQKTDLCLTPQGDPNELGANLIMKGCDVRDDEWSGDRVTLVGEGSYFWLYDPNTYGCVQSSYSSYPPKVIVDSCNDCGAECVWYVEEINGDDDDEEEYSVAFHSGDDKSLCLQAGYGEILEDGTTIRLLECDSEEPLQYFLWEDYEAPIKIANNADLCMVSQGVPGELGAKMIAKDCDERSDEFSGDEIDDAMVLDELYLY